MRSRDTNHGRYFDDDQQRDRGQQYRRYTQTQEGGEYDEHNRGGRWPEERGSNKNNDAYGNRYEDRNYRMNESNDRWQADNQRHYNQQREDRQNQTLRSNYENRYFSDSQGQSRQAFDPSQNDRPGERFTYSPYINENSSGNNNREGYNDHQQPKRRMKQGFGGRNRQRQDNNQSQQPNNLGQPHYGSGAVSGGNTSDRGHESTRSFDERNREGTDWNRYDNREARNQRMNESESRYGNNYGQGYYGESENQGWSHGNQQEDREYSGRQGERNDRNQSGRQGSYLGNVRDLDMNSPEHKSTSRYYSRSRDNDPFI